MGLMDSEKTGMDGWMDVLEAAKRMISFLITILFTSRHDASLGMGTKLLCTSDECSFCQFDLWSASFPLFTLFYSCFFVFSLNLVVYGFGFIRDMLAPPRPMWAEPTALSKGYGREECFSPKRKRTQKFLFFKIYMQECTMFIRQVWRQRHPMRCSDDR